MKWAKSNLGATTPESYGLYFSWGNTDGHPLNSSYRFTEELYNESAGSALDSDIPEEQDAANQLLGGNARIPSKENFEELINNCSIELLTVNGTYGAKLTSNINGQSIFLPAAGQGYQGGWSRVGTWGDFWTRTFGSNVYAMYCTFSDSQAFSVTSTGRRLGFTIRPVLL